MNPLFSKNNCENVFIIKLLVQNESLFNAFKAKLFTINIWTQTPCKKLPLWHQKGATVAYIHPFFLQKLLTKRVDLRSPMSINRKVTQMDHTYFSLNQLCLVGFLNHLDVWILLLWYKTRFNFHLIAFQSSC